MNLHQRRLEKETRVRRVFTPAAPVKETELFAGRTEQMRTVLRAINSDGQHVAIFGEPGVGKTSLGKALLRLFNKADLLTAIYVSCSSSDDFDSLWRKVFKRVSVTLPSKPLGFSQVADEPRSVDLLDLIGNGPLNANTVYDTLENVCAGNRPVMVFIDEFDRIRTRERRPFADLTKAISDSDVNVTLVYIGVAEDVEKLIVEHGSVERNLRQVKMPRMSNTELNDIVERGLKKLELEINELALRRIAVLSRGLPHFTHLVAQHAASGAILDGRETITTDDVARAVGEAVNESQTRLVSGYATAAYSDRTSRYRDVLLACALVSDGNDSGWVSPEDVRGGLTALGLTAGADVPRYLSELCEDARERILVRTGAARRFRYRFRNPLMQPYVVMKALASGIAVEGVSRDGAA